DTVAAVFEEGPDYEARALPEPDVAAQLVQRLLPVRRALLADVAPRPPQERSFDRIRVLDSNPPLFCAVERLPGDHAATVTIPLTLDASFSPRPSCSVCSFSCTHALGALDELLDWLFEPEHERRGELLEAAGEAPWQRWLTALDGALEDLEAETA
ncbi:unnamed protein product, partial [Laminaria digitata]